MITGFNTDIKHNEKVYHIQTEDKGLQNPYIESLVYVGGEILASKARFPGPSGTRGGRSSAGVVGGRRRGPIRSRRAWQRGPSRPGGSA